MSLDRLQTESQNPASAHLDELTPLEIVRLMNREDGRAVEAVGSQAEVIAQAIELIAARLKAGTATKLVLSILTTGAMVRLGKCFGNLMVDLRATNTKLEARTNRIVRTITGLGEATAAELLDRSGGELKTALVAHQAK